MSYAAYVTAYNTTDSPLVVDADGAQIGGGEWGTVDTRDPEVRALIDAGTLTVVEEREPDGETEMNASARAAFKRTADVAAREEALHGKAKAELREIAVDADLIGPEDNPPIHDLRDQLAENPDVEIPAQPSKPTRKTR